MIYTVLNVVEVVDDNDVVDDVVSCRSRLYTLPAQAGVVTVIGCRRSLNRKSFRCMRNVYIHYTAAELKEKN